jgi:DnaK suppressor protein
MDKRKVRQYEARLSEQRNSLLGMVERTEDYGREADRDVSQDPADKASNSYTKELLFSQSTNERNTLRLIEEALDRITEGAYGECVNCGEDIQPSGSTQYRERPMHQVSGADGTGTVVERDLI